jgi:hypothetical protein
MRRRRTTDRQTTIICEFVMFNPPIPAAAGPKLQLGRNFPNDYNILTLRYFA